MEPNPQRGPEGSATPGAGPNTVVVPLDGTDSSRTVLPLAYLLASTFAASLHRVHVATRRDEVQERSRAAHDEALGVLLRPQHASGPADGPGTLDPEPPTSPPAAEPAVLERDVDVVIPGEDPVAALTAYLRDQDDAVVCMASRARGGTHRRRVGNVTEQVTQQSSTPVVAIGPNVERRTLGRPPATLLLAVGAGLPRRTVELVAAWAPAFDAQVVAVHVRPPAGAGDPADIETEVVGLTTQLQGLGIQARARIVSGARPADALLSLAASLAHPVLLAAPIGPRGDDRIPTEVTHQLLRAGRWPVLASAGD